MGPACVIILIRLEHGKGQGEAGNVTRHRWHVCSDCEGLGLQSFVEGRKMKERCSRRLETLEGEILALGWCDRRRMEVEGVAC